MLLLILISIVLIPIIVITSLFYSHKKLPRPVFWLLLFGLFVVPFGIYKNYEKSFMLSFVPDALQIESISYHEEESWGFGPGGNEAGIRVYRLPSHIADEISKRGIEFFTNMPPNKNQLSRDLRGWFGEWHPTPVVYERRKSEEKTRALDVCGYLDVFGFCSKVDEAVLKQATEIVNGKGNYYAFGRMGVIVVSPSRKLVLYMFAK
jgi:hypothetical protein